jgi:hypothetical protein
VPKVAKAIKARGMVWPMMNTTMRKKKSMSKMNRNKLFSHNLENYPKSENDLLFFTIMLFK